MIRKTTVFYYLCYDKTCLVEGPWIVEFGGRRLVLPLHRRFRMAWVAAIAFHGHDPELHHFYHVEGVATLWRPRYRHRRRRPVSSR